MSHTEVWTKIKGKEVWFKIHTWLKSNLDIMMSKTSKDFNFNILISGDGKTRTGKTTFGLQIASYVDKDFPDNWRNQVVYDWEDLEKISDTLKPGQALVYDEARKVLNSTRSMTKYCQNLLDFISEIGDKNLFLIIILPDFFDLPKPLALVQSHILINVYWRKFTRGFFGFFNDRKKTNLYIKGKQWRNYHAEKPSFDGTFTKFFPIDMEEYKKHKHSNLKRIRSKKKKRTKSARTQEYLKIVKILIDHIKKEEGKTQKEIADITGKSQQTISLYLRDTN